MKKMVLNFGGERLSRFEMKNVVGGNTVIADCPGGLFVMCSGGSTCTATDNEGCKCQNGSTVVDKASCPIA